MHYIPVTYLSYNWKFVSLNPLHLFHPTSHSSPIIIIIIIIITVFVITAILVGVQCLACFCFFFNQDVFFLLLSFRSCFYIMDIMDKSLLPHMFCKYFLTSMVNIFTFLISFDEQKFILMKFINFFLLWLLISMP